MNGHSLRLGKGAWARRLQRLGLAAAMVGASPGLGAAWVTPDSTPASEAPVFKSLPTCSAGPVTSPCQVELPEGDRARLEAEKSGAHGLRYSSDGDAIDLLFVRPGATFAFGSAPYLCCDVQTYLVPNGDGIWSARLRIPNLPQAVIGLSIANSTNSGDQKELTYVGRLPDHQPLKASASSATLTKLTLQSAALGGPRAIYVYRGEHCLRGGRNCRTIYLADGDEFGAFLANAPPGAIEDLRSTVIVGLGLPVDDGFGTQRAAELLVSQNKPRDFYAFEEFLVTEVVPQVEGKTPASTRWTGGWSNGGSWALNMALRHPDIFKGAIALSVAAWNPPPARARIGTQFFIGAGTLEPFYGPSSRDAAVLSSLGYRVREKYVVGGHSPATWNALFWDAVKHVG
jgi:enterochelin esterase-like enzyme